ncbi:thrombomodulin-like [Antedon mediterranea]|uniref:thrombomodulin-like n=1 Tax=Antedon mediterranea TaxID=105859 RepID=UPI003AF5C31F
MLTTECGYIFKDINECSATNGGCHHICINTVGSYYCRCRTGYAENDDRQCEDINECSATNGGCHHICINTVGSYYCRCRTGYVENDDRQCEAVCDPPCVHGTCTAPDYCECQENYVGDACDDLNECWTNNGGCAQVCTNTFGGFQCDCWPGYELSMLTDCLPICDPPCENNGNCVGPNNCECPDTYEGYRCEIGKYLTIFCDFQYFLYLNIIEIESI